jgi:hypothetical protein
VRATVLWSLRNEGGHAHLIGTLLDLLNTDAESSSGRGGVARGPATAYLKRGLWQLAGAFKGTGGPRIGVRREILAAKAGFRATSLRQTWP